MGRLIRLDEGEPLIAASSSAVSGPASDYVRFEYDITEAHDIAAGELVRWASPRSCGVAADPAVGFWLFDATVLLFNIFDGDAAWVADAS
jgi:hypothetical protein